jgi:hypothetical protein
LAGSPHDGGHGIGRVAPGGGIAAVVGAHDQPRAAVGRGVSHPGQDLVVKGGQRVDLGPGVAGVGGLVGAGVVDDDHRGRRRGDHDLGGVGGLGGHQLTAQQASQARRGPAAADDLARSAVAGGQIGELVGVAGAAPRPRGGVDAGPAQRGRAGLGQLAPHAAGDVDQLGVGLVGPRGGVAPLRRAHQQHPVAGQRVHGPTPRRHSRVDRRHGRGGQRPGRVGVDAPRGLPGGQLHAGRGRLDAPAGGSHAHRDAQQHGQAHLGARRQPPRDGGHRQRAALRGQAIPHRGGGQLQRRGGVAAQRLAGAVGHHQHRGRRVTRGYHSMPFWPFWPAS